MSDHLQWQQWTEGNWEIAVAALPSQIDRILPHLGAACNAPLEGVMVPVYGATPYANGTEFRFGENLIFQVCDLPTGAPTLVPLPMAMAMAQAASECIE